ncbi:MAG: low molecular weight phosphatase family protein [Brachybacterium paraconglomeratum]|nr:low molecular weight phosphatase family protein [Brachybacterium paraconglomeratum]
MDEKYRVVTVCTGNICRSPAAERLLQARLAHAPEIEVSSVGTHALVDEPIQISMAHLLEQSGISSGLFSAREANETTLRDADLVLGMTRRHRSSVVALAPRLVRRTFTLRELARIAQELRLEHDSAAGTAERLRTLVDEASRNRTPVSGDLDDIADPYRRDLEAYETAFAEIREAVDAIVDSLGR